MPKKYKKYEQSISQPHFEPAPGSKVALALEGLIAKLFGGTPAGPTTQEIIDYHFTHREREVAYLAAIGFSDSEIGESLDMSTQAVRAQLYKVLAKLNLADVRELTDFFLPHDR